MQEDNDRVVRSGFTLIEMLVVILIILLLSGMLFKIAGMVGGKASRAKAVTDIANLESALAEYYSVYDIYPPTSDNKYQFEYFSGQPAGLQALLESNNDPDKDGFITDCDERIAGSDEERGWGQQKSGRGQSLGYKYGLVSYLWLRERDKEQQPHWYDKDTERDKAAKKRWAHCLKDLTVQKYGIKMKRNIAGTEFIYTNMVMRVVDPWNRDYKYECKPPYMQYKLWSVGPDGKNGTADDINNDAFNE